MASVMTLIEFLTDRIAEDVDEIGPASDCDCDLYGLPLRHGVRCPVRMLAECEAKRRIVDRYLAQLDRQGDPEESQLSASICTQEYTDWILPALALPYADHPDYDEKRRL